jgi:hypothetical protein
MKLRHPHVRPNFEIPRHWRAKPAIRWRTSRVRRVWVKISWQDTRITRSLQKVRHHVIKEQTPTPTVVNILLITNAAKYPPSTTITFPPGPSLRHQNTHVVANHSPARPSINVRLPTNAQGESPPISKWPPMMNLFPEGCSSYRRIKRPGLF